jgi:hypothetical protein
MALSRAGCILVRPENQAGALETDSQLEQCVLQRPMLRLEMPEGFLIDERDA